MTFQRDIHWRQGSFLEPQHFQLIDYQRRFELSRALNALHPYPFGLLDLKINETSLVSHFFEIVRLELLTSDGRFLRFPDNVEIAASSFRDSFGPTEEKLAVSLALPRYSLAGGNAKEPPVFSSLGEEPGVDLGRFYPYRAPEEPDLVPDLLGRGPVGRIETLWHQGRVVFGPPKNDEAVDYIPIARLQRDGEKISLDVTYGPPALTFYPGHPGRPILSDVLSSLLARLGQLEEYRFDPVQFRQTDLDGPGQALLALLGIFGRHLPSLALLENAPQRHPYAVYAALANLAGELAIFSPPGGAASESLFLPPKYDHLDPLAALETLKNAIIRLLEALTVGPAVTLSFRRERQYFLLDLPTDGLGEGAYCLAVRSPLAPTELAAALSWRARLGPPGKLEFLAAHSLPGIGLSRQKGPPPGLPSRPDLNYFAIRQNDPLWAEAKDDGRLGLLWPEAPEGALIRLTAAGRKE
ncbi:MAG: type VI secretion system baseplate subunit TssK [Deltaproteobacteria bacterium]|jgi:type VI secretion system protein ImpJ|nr:type VI secretion system baseplate subunit TssK [Deltaproteobacteria bacterium]